MKIIKINDSVTVRLDDGTQYVKEMSDEEFNKIVNMDEDQIVEFFSQETLVSRKKIQNSGILTLRGDSVYWPDVCGYSMPVSLVRRVIEAEEAGNDTLMQTYRNFWTLMAMNSDSRCRENLFWFLEKWGMTVEKSGFFLGYRNVDKTKEKGVYTDAHSHSTRIEIGRVVCMPREQCDCNQDHQCSSGLHVAGAEWLTEGYYGEVGMAVLVNPADVVAVPCDAGYGKLRTCAYLPIGLVEYDDNGNVIPYNVRDGFESAYVGRVIYEGLTGSGFGDTTYHISVPRNNCMSMDGITDELIRIAMESVKNRN